MSNILMEQSLWVGMVGIIATLKFIKDIIKYLKKGKVSAEDCTVYQTKFTNELNKVKNDNTTIFKQLTKIEKILLIMVQKENPEILKELNLL